MNSHVESLSVCPSIATVLREVTKEKTKFRFKGLKNIRIDGNDK